MGVEFFLRDHPIFVCIEMSKHPLPAALGLHFCQLNSAGAVCIQMLEHPFYPLLHLFRASFIDFSHQLLSAQATVAVYVDFDKLCCPVSLNLSLGDLTIAIVIQSRELRLIAPVVFCSCRGKYEGSCGGQ